MTPDYVLLWAIRTPDLAPGGWAFEYENDLYPDTDDAAVISLALRQLGVGDDAVGRGLDWLVGMQSKGGGWGAFDVDNQAMWLYKIPFCDFGKVTDEPSADVTAHALETLGTSRRTTTRASAGSTGSSTSRRTTARGSDAGASTTSTARARRCPRSRRAASRRTIPPMRRAVAWLDSVQQERRRLRRGHPLLLPIPPGAAARRSRRRRRPPGRSSAYVAAGNAEDGNCARAADYLCGVQRPDGDWDEEHFTGTGSRSTS